MNKILKFILLFVVSFFFLNFNIANAQVVNNIKENGYISVYASVSDEVKPNLATVVVYIDSEAKEQSLAISKNNKTSENVINALKTKIDLNTDSIKTLSYSVNPTYTYTKDNKKIFENYKVINSIQIKTKTPEKISEFISVALKSGATRVSGLNYSLDIEFYDFTSLISKASEIAKTRAKAAAKAFGETISGIRQIDVNCQGGSYSRTYLAKSSANSLDSVSDEISIQTESGLINVSVSVNASFWVK